MSFVKGGMAMMSYFDAFGPQVAGLRDESGTVSAISGILKAPFDIIADKLRGYRGLCMDMFRQPKKVLAACEGSCRTCCTWPHRRRPGEERAHRPVDAPRLRAVLVAPAVRAIYWPTLRQIIEALWARGHQTLFYAEGEWNPT